ncbi:MerR family transcriptional regulator [Butyrivibrio sp. FCS006]|uniref:MerR family transcriptional regulator n=1 Tax=Butyrivibrio sp. FCS006 TaxID=1280684 RepID=UPI00041DE16E|nr:MerR family transcriptional regulator [Butyrivibrio sp. FCS006]
MTYTIAQISEKFGVAASTLRYYEDLGLLKNVERAESGHRIYSEDHIGKLEAINCFKKAGMSINEIKDFFEYEKDEAKSIDDMMSLLKRRSEIMLEEFAEAYESYEHILKKLDYYGHIEKALKQGKELPKWAKFDKKDYHQNALDTILDRIS